MSVNLNGKMSGGFGSLNSTQMSKINGGKAPADSNSYCTNNTTCNEANTSTCTNSGTCG
ncbi:hypothetical protein J2W48_003799 [Flavobacterium piscis]|uniref:Bacteriocin n=1 Tax=Flavobacterium piscis TaxID=1114874 RepID=A0ABU1YC83_9FLAO|nr:hypothetical protein [Flavobacterium piscis]